MATVDEVMHSGAAAMLATKIGQMLTTGLVATGTNQATALQLLTSASIFSTVGSGTGALLKSAHSQALWFILNNGANTLAVFPAVGESINGGAANASFSITAGKLGIFMPHNNQWLASLSA